MNQKDITETRDLSKTIMSLPIGVTYVDLNEIITMTNQTFASIIGYSVEELVGTNLSDLISDENMETILEHTKKRKQGESSVYDVELSHKDGSSRIVRVFATPWYDSGGSVIGAIGIITDITQDKFNEAALRESERRLELALRGAELGIWDWNLLTDKMKYNDRWAAILGYEFDEIVESVDFFESHVHPDDFERVDKTWQVHAQGKTDHYECRFRMRTKTGEWRWILDRGKIVEWTSDGKPIRASGTHLDITQQMESEKLREQYQRELEIYSSIIRHDLSNDLMILQGQLEVLAMIISQENGRAIEMIQTAEVVANRMGNLLKTISKPDGELESSLVDMVARVAREAEGTSENLRVKLRIEKETKGIEVVGGRLLPSVFENILRNSVAYGGKRIRVVIDIRRKDRFMEIQLTDNGPGINDEIKPYLFERGVSTREGEGKGLGLYLSRQIIETLGGSIQLVDSPTGKGASFLVRLPISQ